jgi:hypothetical protein
VNGLSRHPLARWTLLAVLVFVYFVLYPQDLSALLTPLERVLAVSTAVSPWLYGVIGIAILCWTLVRIWGRPGSAVNRDVVPPT